MPKGTLHDHHMSTKDEVREWLAGVFGDPPESLRASIQDTLLAGHEAKVWELDKDVLPLGVELDEKRLKKLQSKFELIYVCAYVRNACIVSVVVAL